MCVSLVAMTSVFIVARRGSDGGVEQRVRHERPEASRECVSRASVGCWS